jgi:hypothetical protein
MQFLDAIGLAYFWEKIKNWVNINYLSLTGGTINGDVNISGNVSALQFKKTNGTSTQVLIADGSVKGIGSANGIAGLDSNGYVPLAQLGNLDTTVAEVVTALPTTNIKKHIYLIKDTDGVTQNQYEEYLYTGDTSATYDASKWEKLGDFRATVDLANYAKKSETVEFSTIRLETKPLNEAPQIQQQIIKFENFNGYTKEVVIKDAESAMAGFMSVRDKNKLDLFDTSQVPPSGINVAKLLTVDYNGIVMKKEASRLTVVLNTIDKSSISVDFRAASPHLAGLMSGADKTKLDGISSGATADSAITTAEIDALFA